ncbi:DNA transposition protein, AAA+ family ATPase [Microbacterium azadirachtae]|nr:DNA transposition protein, AAA+ family ATPase [Microbacterium azadirachtae]SEG16178.1 DNA transposition protein, AAA+ family ATPase [Microbacterium azadirachtae]SEG18725.1 DNA transposition protein, AAA+ family ATPase [Microbacterium azadirachtae]
MSFGDRALFNQGRAQYSQAGAFVRTPQFNAFQRAVRDRVMLNAYRRVGKLGLILSGEPGQGKTTSLVEIGRAHERRRRDTSHAVAKPGMLPVVYVAVPAQCSAKALMHEFARFLGLPVLGRMTYGDLLDAVANALRRCSTELVLVDDVHHLDLKYRQNVEASDMLKQLSERCGGTFVYAGIAVEATGLLDGARGGQIGKRFEVHVAAPFSLVSVEEKARWGDLLLALESSLCLAEQQPGSILSAAQTLHALTGGEIGLLKDLLQLAALSAMDDGTERLDVSVFERDLVRRQTAATLYASKPRRSRASARDT